jgi:hypothetical protein
MTRQMDEIHAGGDITEVKMLAHKLQPDICYGT